MYNTLFNVHMQAELVLRQKITKGELSMDKKILIAVDDSIHSKNALRYVAGMSAILMDLNFTLFHVQPAISQFLLDEARISAKANSELKKIIQKNSRTARNMLETYKFQMIKMGIDE
ncbi:MAG TPA: universal stress protein, partial [Desulfobacteraceae bacterium]|nr:universal stress protein [Desulfobacteraceae bacterium]